MTEILLGLVTPFRDIVTGPAFFVEVLLGGIAAGLMYSLVALGFVLIFKASGVFNFAQGVMVLFAALTLVGLMERGVPVAVALIVTMAVMVGLAFLIERVVLRPLVNQEAIILFMATIGLNFFLEGFGEMLWRANVKKLDVGIPDRSFIVAGLQVNQLQISSAASSAAPSKTGSPTSWRWSSCSSVRKASSAKRSSSAYEGDDNGASASFARRGRGPARCSLPAA